MKHSASMALACRVLGIRAMRAFATSVLLVAVGLLCCLASIASAAEVDDGVAQIAKLEGERAQLDRDRRAAEQAYQSKVGQVAQLKAQPSSWGRDRKLGKLLAESKDMATALDKKDEQIRALADKIAAKKQQVIAAIDRELA